MSGVQSTPETIQPAPQQNDGQEKTSQYDIDVIKFAMEIFNGPPGTNC